MRRSLACYRKAGLNIETFSTIFMDFRQALFNFNRIAQHRSFIIWENFLKNGPDL